MCRRRCPFSNRRRVGFSSKAAVVVFSVLVHLAFLAHPTAAIGGWETIHIFWRRLSGERAQNESSRSPSNPKVAPLSGGVVESEDKDNGASSKKRHVGEVTMISSENSSSSSCRPTMASAALPRGRRGGLKLDEKDLQTITFVGRSPFL
jgi:hypothetical protein